jgi:hypothetical protein
MTCTFIHRSGKKWRFYGTMDHIRIIIWISLFFLNSHHLFSNLGKHVTNVHSWCEESSPHISLRVASMVCLPIIKEGGYLYTIISRDKDLFHAQPKENH